MNYNDFLITFDNSINKAIKQLDDTAKKILFVVKDNRLVGSLTDGDIRRFIMSDGDLSKNVLEAANRHPKFLLDSEREKSLGYMIDERINALPIVDDNYNVIDIAFLHMTADLSRVTVRELTKADRELIIRFFDQMAGDTRAMFNRGDINRIRVENYLNGDVDNEKHFIATVNDNNNETVVGYVFLWETDKLIPWLGIAVHEQWKGFKLGRLLMEYIEDFSLSNGYGGILLTTVPANVRAQSLYTRYGYEYLGMHYSGEYLYLKRFNKSE